jgi:hypothetical protein
MELELPEHWRRHLQKLPESSMGSQHVDIALNTGNIIKNVTVFNGRYAQLPRALGANEVILDIVIHEMKKEG